VSRDDKSGQELETFRTEDWISAAEAIARIRTATRSPAAHIHLAKRAHAGLLRTHAALMIFGDARRHENCDVPTGFWWAEGEAALDQNWDLGDFETWLDREVRIRAFGVRFHREDVELMAPTSAMPGDSRVKPAPQKEAGGRPMSALWPEWVAELAALIHDEGLPDGAGSAGVDELISRVSDRLANRSLESPARATVQQTAKAVLHRLRSDRN
jgi:hypothetical protein